MEEKPNYYAIIPANVRYDKDLKDKAKLLYGEIVALTQRNGECWATNNYFAELYGVSKMTISRLIQDLVDKHYISIEIKYKENTKEIVGRYIRICIYPYIQNCIYPIYKNLKENNTSINNKKENIIINNNIKEKFFENDKINDLFIEFLQQRKKLKAINSERAIKQLVDKLNLYDDLTKEQMINESIVNSWKGVFPIKKNNIKKDEWWKKYEN